MDGDEISTTTNGTRSGPTVFFKTFGCRQNQYDTDYLKELFRNRGYRVVEEGPADIVVVNTCAVTGRSVAKARQAIRSFARQGAKVVVTGCYAQVAPEHVAGLPGVVAVSGVRGKGLALEALDEALKGAAEKPVVRVLPHRKGEVFEGGLVEHPTLTHAYLKVQEGCEDYCTYCIVPFARGPSRSKPVAEVLKEAEKLIAAGKKELVLTGTHLGLYGPPSLSSLVKEICRLPGLLRLRLSSLEPHDIDDELLDCLRIPQVCHHLHLPLQSGSDRILNLMGRKYTVASFARIAESARLIAPDLGLGTDIIVGFPGETDRDFESTLRALRDIGFSRVHAFRYSARPGTRAASLPGKVPEKEKSARLKEVLTVARELSLEFHRNYIGVPVEVLVEEKPDRGMLTGVTRSYVRCWFDGRPDWAGEIKEIVPTKASFAGLIAVKREA